MLMARAFHRANGEGEQRTKVLVPDSAHGTNPATATMVGYETVTIRSNERGGIDLEALRAALGPDVAALMITNPSTLGIFEDQIDQVVAAVKEAGAIAYMDGANLNAILGRFRPGEAGFDVMHFNLHKTFSTPHGGGGPGAGPVGVSARLEPFLPRPIPVLAEGDQAEVLANARAGRSTPAARFALDDDRPQSIGKVRSCYGNFGMFVRAYTYIRRNGDAGLRDDQRGRRARRQLPPRPAPRRLRPAVRPAEQARGRLQRPAPEARAWRHDARHRQGHPRPRHPSADDLLPADRRGGADGRADRDRVDRDARSTSSRSCARSPRWPRPIPEAHQAGAGDDARGSPGRGGGRATPGPASRVRPGEPRRRGRGCGPVRRSHQLAARRRPRARCAATICA